MRQLNQHQFEEQHSGEVFGRVASDPTVSRLVTAHSDKKKTAPNYKRGYGFHPLCAFVDHDHGDGGTGEPVAMLLRPGNGFDQNRIWLEIVQLACELMAWMHMLAFGADSPETARARAARTSTC